MKKAILITLLSVLTTNAYSSSFPVWIFNMTKWKEAATAENKAIETFVDKNNPTQEEIKAMKSAVKEAFK